ncbi:MAG: hypothetical protein V3W20_10670 [Candidatus Neomarinimicrobiota bacterium]
MKTDPKTKALLIITLRVLKFAVSQFERLRKDWDKEDKKCMIKD